jgi:hypothetical protein
VSDRKGSDIRGVAAIAQLLPDSDSLGVPQSLLNAKARFGIAVRQVPSSSGRPMLQVLLLVAR